MIEEITPAQGYAHQETVVSILGKNLRCEGPCWNIYFGTYPVDKSTVKFYGTDALLCKTPKHPPGKVHVVIQTSKEITSNDKEFLFLDVDTKQEPLVPNSVSVDHFFPDILHSDYPPSMKQNAFFLHQLCGEGKYDVDFSQYTLEQINQQDDQGCTPLFWAVYAGHTKIAKHLLHYPGIDVNAKNKEGLTILHLIADRGLINLWYILKNLKVEINSRDNHLNTPLHYAAVNGFHDLANEFIHYGADVNSLNDQEESPLHWAYLSEESESIVRLLR